MNPPQSPPTAPVKNRVLEAALFHRRELRSAAALSFAVGLLMLVPSWYMFEVYGRVLNSRNVETLWWLVLMVLGTYLVVELLDLARARQLYQVGVGMERKLRSRLFDNVFEANLRKMPGGTLQPFNDLKTLREFLSSPALTAVLDMPAAIICLVLLFVLSPWLGLVGLAGMLMQGWLVLLTERRTMPLLNKATEAGGMAQVYAMNTMGRAPVIESMGMLPDIHARWHRMQNKALNLQASASDYAGTTSAIAKLIQVMQGSILLGAACLIMLEGKLLGGAGMVIVASIIGGRALQPLAQLVPNWRTVIQARDSLARMNNMFAQHGDPEHAMELPSPRGLLTVENAIASAPGSQAPILRGVSFHARPGEVTGVIGPSASGKTTLARLLVGVWPCLAGKVRLDGADVYAWDKRELGPHVGYLPQNIELFDGTVAENIARFGTVDMDQVRAAARLVGLEAILDQLPEGFDTVIGADGTVLSGGQRQRLGLARALYGNPQLVVLDEPNSSLDEAGEQQLLAALAALKARRATVIAITHRTNLLQVVDNLLVLKDGQVALFGPRNDVLQALKGGGEPPRPGGAAPAQQPQPVQIRRASGAPL